VQSTPLPLRNRNDIQIAVAEGCPREVGRRVARRGDSRVPPQPCFFDKENTNEITPNATKTAATVKPAVEISARE
jgi:hypothetical protein